ncbi:hypothetical protein U9M48_011577 [Paspalum notatum var. saurae]|uniref:F-box domain-containing protein n=1 Tax=Paspalum notatum var. saurae TaxID=547442 RepID=A0AAQ3SW38_PASNO
MAPPSPNLTGDAVAEILLRHRPEDPASLVRASLVCKPWRRILSDPTFPRRYRELHRTPPLLGFLDGAYACEALISGSFVPVAPRVPPLIKPALEPASVRRAVDCRHGRVLVHTVGATTTRAVLALWDPVTGDHRVIRCRNPDVRSYNQRAAVLCSAAGCDHRDCHGGPFAVVTVGNAVAGPPRAVAWAYSSEAAAWSASVSLDLGQDPSDVSGRGAIVGDGLYFLLGRGTAILKYHLGEHCLSVIDSPCVSTKPMVLMAMEDEGSLGLAGVLGSTLHLWSRKVDDDDPTMGVETTWVQHRVIDLGNLLPLDGRSYHEAYVTGFAEGVHALFVSTDATIFVFELKSERVRKVGQVGFYYDVLPFMRFCIPDFASSKIGIGSGDGLK